LGLSVGLGVGLPWLLDDGLSMTAALGMVALVVGLVSLLAGGVWLVRAPRGWRRLAVIPWLLALAVGTYCLAIALAATFVAPSPVGNPPAEVGQGSEVRLTTEDGVQLGGWYLPGRNGAAVVVRHGSGSNRFAGAGQAAVLARHGYGVLLVDARGHGTSEGRAMDLGWNGEADTAAAVDFLAGAPGVDPDRIGVLGLSMGAEEALGAAGTDPRIRTVVAEGATGRTAADKAWLSQEYGLAGVLQEQLDRLTYALVDLLASAPVPASLAESVRAAPATPILLIAADQVPDEGHVASRLASISPGTVDVWVAPGGHVAALPTTPAEWERRIITFLDTTLLAPAPPA
jgi:pimeloyl-ACP methyl ester carboxylesterase